MSKRRQKNTLIVICIIVFFISTSIVPALSSISLKERICDFAEQKVESFFEKRIIDTSYNNIVGMEEVEHDIDLIHELYPEYYRDYPMNQSVYLFNEHYDDYQEYIEYNEEMMERYLDMSKTISSKPNSKPDFENGTTWYVDDVPGEEPDNPPEDFSKIKIPDSKFNNPPEDFTKIQDAVNASKDGDTIYVYSGIYYENIFLNKSIILQGEDKRYPIIDGSRSGRNAVDVVVDWISICGFVIKNNGYGNWDALININSNFNTIKYNNITGGEFIHHNKRTGIRLDYSSNFNNIIGNDINYNYYAGIEIMGQSKNNNIDGNNISNNKLCGIWIKESSNNSIINNTIIKNDKDGIWLDTLSDNNTINDNNLIKNNNWSGIKIWSDNNTIKKNGIIGNHRCGIELIYSSNNTISNNTISNHKWSGIWLDFNSNNIITHNNLIRNKDGIELDHSSYNLINKNKCNNNRQNGIIINKGTKNNIIQFNNCTNNTNGIAIIYELYYFPKHLILKNIIFRNVCKKNNKGMLIENLIFNNIQENICSENYCGIEIKSSYLNKIERCTFSNNILYGIESYKSKFNFITYCNLIDNDKIFDINRTHYNGEPGDKNFFFRNYWSGRFVQSFNPYLIQINLKSFDKLLPLKPLTYNWDWFPKARPYNYDYT